MLAIERDVQRFIAGALQHDGMPDMHRMPGEALGPIMVLSFYSLTDMTGTAVEILYCRLSGPSSQPAQESIKVPATVDFDLRGYEGTCTVKFTDGTPPVTFRGRIERDGIVIELDQ